MSIIAEAKKEQFSLLLDYKQEIKYIEGDLDNVKQMLPKLYSTQHEDVHKAMMRFLVGKGMLFTNGTGTGKTFVGLGISHRFYSKGKTSQLIVTPNDAKCEDWILEAQHVDLVITMIEGTKDAGRGISTTTYANFYQNYALLTREFDLIIYDESHYLTQNASGKHTVYLDQHKRIANVPSVAKEKAMRIVGDPPEYRPNCELWNSQAEAWRFRLDHVTWEYVEKTKVVFLSATPFAYRKSIKYADGCLFDIWETLNKKPPSLAHSGEYNEPNPWEAFMIENFGYRMSYDKLTIPESGVDLDLMERAFFEKYQEKGVMSTRILELEQDYSRQFVTVDSELGDFINDGIEMFSKQEIKDKYKNLSELVSKKYNYNYINQLLEAIKAKQTVERAKQHIALGRKVVVFHSFNHNLMEHPFKFNPSKITKKEEKHLIPELRKEIAAWEEEFPEYVNLDLDGISNVRKTFTDAFHNCLQINGTIPKKKRKHNENLFNNSSQHRIILIQKDAGKEGISLHDKFGDFQRVELNLCLPTRPTEAIQIEGRIYRDGVLSDAIYEYMSIQTNFERIAFAEKIAERARTAENLAMGNLARDLENSFKEAYLASSKFEPYIGQGVGGKAQDRQVKVFSAYDKAKSYYFAQMKRNSKTKNKEGGDTFFTAEPLGYKMIQWLKIKANERFCEPSAGVGSIGRFAPGHSENTFIEINRDSYAKMMVYCKGNHKNEDFEEYNIINKYECIAMNPPFGVGGKEAFDHIQKAVINHLSQRRQEFDFEGSRLVAIVPDGPSMNKRLDELYESNAFRHFNLTAEVLLPSCAFERAGTNVRCKVIKIEHAITGNETFRKIDLSYCNDIQEFFEELEYLEI